MAETDTTYAPEVVASPSECPNQIGADRSIDDRRFGRRVAKRLWYASLQVLCRTTFPLLFRVRCRGREHLRLPSGGIIVSNHQSHLDPVLIGVAADRRLNFLARQSLFRFGPLKLLIESLDAIPIDRDGTGLGGLKETLRRLKQGEAVLIFAEGTRTADGQVHDFKPGFLPLVRRSGLPLVPVAIDGAWQAWPRTQAFPRAGNIHVEAGPPLTAEQIADMTDDELLAEARRRVVVCQQRARRRRRAALMLPE